jgi:hypothetical protein
MVEQVTFQTIFQFLQTVSILVGVYYYITTIRTNQRNQELTLETRQLQLYMKVLEDNRTKEFQMQWIDVAYNQEFKDYEEWREKYGPKTNPEAYANFFHVTNWFQGIGYLVKTGVLDVKVVSEYIRPRSVVFLWEKVEPIVKVHRETTNPGACESFEYLVHEIEKMLERRIEEAGIRVD